MTIRRQTMLVLLVALLVPIGTRAQWIQTNGPYAGYVRAFATISTNLFAGTETGGVFLSTNGGASWTPVNDGLMNTSAIALAASATNLFVGTYGGGVFLSTNNGTNWTEANVGLTNKSVQVLVVAGTNLFAGTDGGLFLSTNGGASWTNAGLTGTVIRSFAVSGTSLFAGTENGDVFRSTNNGSTWDPVNAGLPSKTVYAFAVSGPNLFAGTGQGVFLSTNSGTSWTRVDNGFTRTDVEALVVSEPNLFAGTYGGGVYLSTNNGVSWTPANNGLTNMIVRALAVSGPNLFAGTYSGAWRRPLADFPPPPPVALLATNVEQTRFAANWTTVIGATGYRLDVATNSGFTTFVPGYADLNVGSDTTRLVTGLSPNTTYYYQVRAVNAGGASGNSNMISVLTPSPPEPGVPTALPSSNINQTNFTANWTTVIGATGYRLDVATNSGFTAFVPGYADLNAGSDTTRLVTGLSPNTTYYYQVRAVSAGGPSGNSNPMMVTTLPIVPVAPTANPAKDVNQTSFTANWTAVIGATGYRLDAATNSGFTAFVPGYADLNVGSDTTRLVTGLSPNTTYYYQVRAVNAGGPSGNSNPMMVTTLPIVPFAPTANAAKDVNQTSFTANWTAVIGATGYRLDVATNSGFTAFVPGYADLNVGSDTTRLVTGLSPSTTYYYQVRAVTAGGPSGNSNTVPVTTASQAPALHQPPDNAIAQAPSVILRWRQVPQALRFHVQVSCNPSFLWHVENDSTVTDTLRVVQGLAYNTTYYWRVATISPNGKSTFGSPAYKFRTRDTLAFVGSMVFNFTSWASSTDYRILSFPGTTAFTATQLLAGNHLTDWRVFEDNGGTPPDHLSELGANGTIAPGKGYWILRQGALALTQTVVMPGLDTNGTCAIPLRAGWNIIGNPVDKPVSWDAIRQANGSITSNLYGYGGSTLFESSPQMEPFKGYYFYNATGLQSLRIVYPFAARPANAAPEIPLQWKLQLAFETPEYRDVGNILGVGASTDVDIESYNQRKPPSFKDQPSLYFPLPGKNGSSGKFSSDFRASIGEGAVWNFEVDNPLLQSARIRIVGLENVPAEYEVFLINPHNSKPNDMRKNSTYAYLTTAQKMWFQLIIGKNSFTQAQLTAAIPKEFRLEQNYPNPFNPVTVIQFGVPQPAHIRVEICSNLGQRLRTLIDTNFDPGSYSITWDGTTTSGGKVSSGPYFYRMFVNGRAHDTKRMMLLK